MNNLIPNPLYLSVKRTIRRANKSGYNMDDAMMASRFAVVYFTDKAQIVYIDPFESFKPSDCLKNVIIVDSMELARSYFEKLANVKPDQLLRKDEVITCIELVLSDAELMVYDEDSVKPKEGWAYHSNVQVVKEALAQLNIYLDLL